ncbi:radical SAM protein [Oleidesulfovibrio sp.]|uniref:radical SAM protein n=1 Tax=Oleidesulfovibrio sp. TaxID=2909707 RepID=UPI003A8C3000
MTFAYVFGPVASSRLGHSLGLDLLGKRICSMDCLYCEVGRTDSLTSERAPYVPAKDILNELAAWRNENPTTHVDYVTLGGSGEPTLNSDMGLIISGCKQIMPDEPVAVLTNATLMHHDDVRAELALADVVLPSLDSLVESEFRAINRPAKGITARQIADSLLSFRKEYGGQIFLEILLSQGVNDSQENLTLLKQFVLDFAPDRVDVTTLSRPGAFEQAKPVPREIRAAWCDALNACLPEADPQKRTVFLRTGQRADFTERDDRAVETMLHQTLARRPQTAGQLALALSLPLDRVERALDALIRSGSVTTLPAGIMQQGEGKEPFFALAER